MKNFVFVLLLAYLFVSFSVLFKERPSKLGRILVLIFLGPWIVAYENIKAALGEGK